MDTSPADAAQPANDAAHRGDPIDPDTPNASRRYDYWLGGKDNYAIDRDSGDAIAARYPEVRRAVLANRAFLQRAVTYLTREAGIRQFLDIGAGIPTPPNVHEIAQEIAPDARVVYVDNDPVVGVHARARMASSYPNTTTFISADLRDPVALITHPALAAALDLTKPVAVLLVAVVHFLDDDDAAYRVVKHLVQALPPGSYLALTHVTYDVLPDEVAEGLIPLSAPGAGHGPFRARTHAEVTRFFDGLDLVHPGLTSIERWRPDEQPGSGVAEAATGVYGGVARLPAR